MCRCSYVHIPGTAVMVEYVVVLLWNGCTAGPVCSGVLVSCCSAFRRASGGHKGGHMTGPCKAELVTPTVPLQTHIPLASFCLFIVSPLLSTVADMALSLMFLSLLVSGSRSLTFQSWRLHSRCTCCHKGNMDISTLLSQQSSVLTLHITTHQPILCLDHSLTFTWPCSDLLTLW